MAFNYYFAGATTPRIESEIVRLGANVLKSFYTDKATLKRWFEHKKNGWQGKLFIDNGEFSMHRHGGTINIDEYIKYLNDNDAYIDYAVALDKIPGVWGCSHTQEEVRYASEQTYNNYLYMREHCISPEKIIPVFHQEEEMSVLERLLNIDGLSYICIAGRKDLTPASRKEFYSDVFHIIKGSKNPNIKTHCLGSGTLSDVELFPFTSTDSTSCNMVAANGNIFINGAVVYVGDGGKSLSDAAKEIVLKYCEDNGVVLSELEKYQDRAILNIRYMFNMSNKVECKKSNFIKESLF